MKELECWIYLSGPLLNHSSAANVNFDQWLFGFGRANTFDLGVEIHTREAGQKKQSSQHRTAHH
jgi:hypothetical protein